MKKMSKAAITVALSIAMTIAMTACGGTFRLGGLGSVQTEEAGKTGNTSVSGGLGGTQTEEAGKTGSTSVSGGLGGTQTEEAGKTSSSSGWDAIGGTQSEEVGKYTLYEMKSGAETVTNSMLTVLGMTNAYIEIRADGTATMAFFDGEKEEMKWGNGNLTSDGDSVPYSYNDGFLTVTVNSDQLIFRKS